MLMDTNLSSSPHPNRPRTVICEVDFQLIKRSEGSGYEFDTHGTNQSPPLPGPLRQNCLKLSNARRQPLWVHLGFAGGFCQLEAASDGRELNENDKIEYNMSFFFFSP